VVDKQHEPPLPSPIRSVCYLSTDAAEESGDAAEVYPRVNQLVVRSLQRADAVIYGAGSLYTSICPSLVVRGVGEEVSRLDIPKVLMLNGSPDRETTRTPPMAASDYVAAVVHALNRTHASSGSAGSSLHRPASAYVNVLFYPEGAQRSIPIDIEVLEAMGVRAVSVPSVRDAHGRVVYQPQGCVNALAQVLAEGAGG